MKLIFVLANVLVMIIAQLRFRSTPYLPDKACRQKMAADQGKAPVTLDQSRVGSEDYLSSLTRRLDALEKKLVGDSGMKKDQPPLNTTVNVSSPSGVGWAYPVRGLFISQVLETSDSDCPLYYHLHVYAIFIKKLWGTGIIIKRYTPLI